MESHSHAPIGEHLAELRHRLLVVLAGFLGVLVFTLYFSTSLIDWLMLPLKQARPDLKLAALTLTEGFITTMRVAVYAAIAGTLPLATWQAWQFVKPGLLATEQRFFALLWVPMVGGFVAGSGFAYFVVAPLGIRFLIEFLGSNFVPMGSFDSYVGFMATLMLVLGILGELPFLLLLLDWSGLVSAERVRGYRKHAIVTIFIIAAVCSPPDPFSQILVALPMIVLFEGGIWLCILGRRFKPAGANTTGDSTTNGASCR